MKRAFCCVILSAAVVAACACARGQSNVYWLGIYSAGHSYSGLCSLSVPFPPYQYSLQEHHWSEDANGRTITGFATTRSAVLRRLLEVQCGSNSFNIPLELGGVRKKAPADLGPSGTAGSGDLALLVTRCVANRGGHAKTAKAATAPVTWIHYSRETEDIIVLAGDHFAEVQKFLEQTYGAADSTIQSSASARNVRPITYGPQQIGAMLNLTAGWTETIITVVGKRKA